MSDDNEYKLGKEKYDNLVAAAKDQEQSILDFKNKKDLYIAERTSKGVSEKDAKDMYRKGLEGLGKILASYHDELRDMPSPDKSK